MVPDTEHAKKKKSFMTCRSEIISYDPDVVRIVTCDAHKMDCSRLSYKIFCFSNHCKKLLQ